MNAKDYFLVLKTGQSEMKGFKELPPHCKAQVTPVVELTRGRKNHKNTIAKTGVDYNFSAIEEFAKAEFGSSKAFFVDVTSVESLSSSHTKEIRCPDGGYANWVSYFSAFKASCGAACPIIQINPKDDDDENKYAQDVKRQFDALSSLSSKIGYRAKPKEDVGFDYDLFILKQRIEAFVSQGGEFYLFLDYDYVRPGTGDLYALEVVKVLDAIHETIDVARVVLIATSFPNSVTDVGGASYGEFSEEEVALHAAVARLAHNKFLVGYGDYGSINPVRNDEIIPANGWRPRIDYPYGGERIFYYREGRQFTGKGKDKVFTTSYSQHYASVAQSIVSDEKFISDPLSSDLSCWGVAQIVDAAKRSVKAASPGHWISVRFNIHVVQQLKRLGLA